MSRPALLDLASPARLSTHRPRRRPWCDIVLARVAGTVYLHLVSAVDATHARIQISNNRGRVNGWTTHARVYGICVAVDGVARPRTRGKSPI